MVLHVISKLRVLLVPLVNIKPVVALIQQIGFVTKTVVHAITVLQLPVQVVLQIMLLFVQFAITDIIYLVQVVH